MQWNESRKKDIQKIVEQLLSHAEDQFETAVILMEHDKFQHSSEFLKRSFQRLADCYFTIHDLKLPSNDTARIEQWQTLDANQTLAKAKYAALPKQVLELDEQFFEQPASFKQYTRMAADYQNFFQALTHQIKKTLRQELATIEDLRKMATRKKKVLISSVVAALVVLATSIGSYARYHSQEPIRIFYESAQFFWTSPTSPEFSEANQKRVRLVGNDTIESQTILLKEPVLMSSFRLDPSSNKLKSIEVEQIELLDENQTPKLTFNFNAEDPPWKMVNVRSSEYTQFGLKIEPKNHDPYLISEPFPEILVSAVRLKIRLTDNQPFIDWILRNDPRNP